jgi:uncharacterized protein
MLRLINQITEIYNAIDLQIETFQQASGLQCPSGCGKCCENPQVETTPLEALPLAYQLINSHKAEYWLERITQLDDSHLNSGSAGVCVFYEPDPLVAGNGRCSVYAWRPSLCRLFGFASVKNKHDQLELAACTIHKQSLPTALAKLPKNNQVDLAPNFSDFSMQLRNLQPDQSYLLPINQAVAIAINKVGLFLQYS